MMIHPLAIAFCTCFVLFAGYKGRQTFTASKLHLLRDEGLSPQETWFGDSLPPALPPQLSELFWPVFRVRNCIAGYRYGERFACFEYSKSLSPDPDLSYFEGLVTVSLGRRGVPTWKCCIAFEQHNISKVKLPWYCRVRRYEHWLIITADRFIPWTWSYRNVAGILDTLRTTTDTEAHHEQQHHVAADNILIRPRHDHFN